MPEAQKHRSGSRAKSGGGSRGEGGGKAEKGEKAEKAGKGEHRSSHRSSHGSSRGESRSESRGESRGDAHGSSRSGSRSDSRSESRSTSHRSESAGGKRPGRSSESGGDEGRRSSRSESRHGRKVAIDPVARDPGDPGAPAAPAGPPGAPPPMPPVPGAVLAGVAALNASSPPPAPAEPPRCENCGQPARDGSVFCPTCNLVLCLSCDLAIHSAAAFTAHERRPSWESRLYRHPCRYHPGKHVAHFCTTCDEPVCTECRISGPHAGAAHTVVTMQDAFYSKVNSLAARVAGPLRSKREVLQLSCARIESVLQAVHRAAGEIERATRMDYEGILTRLKKAEGMKAAVCQQELDLVRQDLLAVEALTQRLNGITLGQAGPGGGPAAAPGAGPSPLPNLQSLFRQAAASSSFLAAGPGPGPGEGLLPLDAFGLLEAIPSINSQIDGILARVSEADSEDLARRVNPAELPREVCERNAALAAVNGGSRQLEVKEELIRLAEEEKDRCIGLARAELGEWEKLVKEYAEELRRVSMRCVFCGRKCEPDTVNAECEANRGGSDMSFAAARRAEPILASSARVQAEEAMRYVGNGRHWFAPAEGL